jgi:hypothetical protein
MALRIRVLPTDLEIVTTRLYYIVSTAQATFSPNLGKLLEDELLAISCSKVNSPEVEGSRRNFHPKSEWKPAVSLKLSPDQLTSLSGENSREGGIDETPGKRTRVERYS